MTDSLAAAQCRAAAVTQRSHRPRERRCNPLPDARASVGFLSRMTVRDPGDLVELALPDDAPAGIVTFDGYASVYEAPYEMWDAFGPYTEVVSVGAAAASLATDGLDVPLVLGHDSVRRIARTTNGTLALTEDGHGLRVVAELDAADEDVSYIVPKIRAGLIDEMSFMFRIVKGMWSPDYTEYRIDAFDIHRGDVSIVGYGANPATSAELRTPTDLRLRLALAAAL